VGNQERIKVGRGYKPRGEKKLVEGNPLGHATWRRGWGGKCAKREGDREIPTKLKPGASIIVPPFKAGVLVGGLLQPVELDLEKHSGHHDGEVIWEREKLSLFRSGC